MKTLITPLLLLTTIFLPSSHAAYMDPVLDYDGQPVVAGEKYYVLPVRRSRGGGLTLSTQSNDSCTKLYGIQSRLVLNNGDPVIFHPAYPNNDTTIRTSMDFNVEVISHTACVRSTVWKLADPDATTRRRYVTADGGIGNPGPNTMNNWFRIEVADSMGSYKIVFCNSMCPSCKVRECGAVGVREDCEWDRLLTLHGEELRVLFVRVGSGASEYLSLE